MVRIGGSTDRGAHIKEADYYTPQGEFRIDKEGSPTLLNCLMYKMCYYRFGEVYTEGGESLSVPLICQPWYFYHNQELIIFYNFINASFVSQQENPQDMTELEMQK